MIDIKKTSLTKRQYEILRKKIEGKSLSDISKELRTSRSNISSIARTAKENIEKCRDTLKLMELVDWPIKITVKTGSNIYDVSETVFNEADRKKIKISHNYSDLVRFITEVLGSTRLKRRKTLRKFTIAVSGEGRFEIF